MSSTLSNVPIALIGGAGFIGHALAIALKRLGADVHVIDSLADSDGSDNEHHWRADALERSVAERLDLLRAERVPIHPLDARQYDMLNIRFNRIKPRIVVHLASGTPDKRTRQPRNTFDHDLRTLENALDYSRSGGIELFVYCSTTGVYGTAAPATEDATCAPVGLTEAMKFSGERIVLAYHNTFDLPYVIARLGPVYGPRSSLAGGIGDLLAASLRPANGQKLVLPQKLPLLYIEDAVAALVACLSRPEARNQIINIAGHQAVAVDEFVALLKPRGRLPAIEAEPLAGTGDVATDKARRLLGFSTKTTVEIGVRETLLWLERVLTPQS